VLGLFQLYPTIYFHKATRGAERIFFELLCRTIQLIKDGSICRTALSSKHPLVRFAQNSDILESALALDDTVVWGALSLMAESPDKCIADLAIRLRDRKLYKCADVRAAIAYSKSDDAATSPEADTVCAKIQDELEACAVKFAAEDADAPPRILLDEAERSPYKRMTEDMKGPLNQINIHTEGDRLEDLAKRSKVVAELKSYKAFRVYYRDGDEVAKSSITEIVKRGIEKWAM
jgi:HD superfamily phosphohydrolase